MNFADLAQRVSKLAIDHSPAILTTIGVVGTVTTAYLAGKASFEAADIIRLKEADDEQRGVPVPAPRELIKDRVELVWRLYIPPLIMGTASVACIIGANRVGASRAAGLAAGYTLLERSLDEYQKKVVETLGAKKEQGIRDAVAQDRVDDTYIEDVRISGVDQGEICYDMFGGQYFRSTVNDLESAKNNLNATIIHDGYACLADFYRILDMDVPPFAESVGWNSDRLMDLEVSTTLLHGIKPCLTIDFKNAPRPDYGRFHR